jgi:hypothetical protein
MLNFEKKTFFLQIVVFEKSSRMVKLIFGADHKSAFRIFFTLPRAESEPSRGWSVLSRGESGRAVVSRGERSD